MKRYIKAGLGEFFDAEDIGQDSEFYANIPVPKGWKSWNFEETSEYFNFHPNEPTGNWSLITKETSHKGLYIGIARYTYGNTGRFIVLVVPGHNLCSYTNFEDAFEFADNLSDDFIWQKFSYAMKNDDTSEEDYEEDYDEDKFGIVVRSKNGLDPWSLQESIEDALSGCKVTGFDVEEDDYDETKALVGVEVEWYDKRPSTTIERLIKKAIRESGFIIVRS